MSEPSLPFGGVMRELARARRMLSRGDLEGAHHVLLETRYRAPEALRGLEEFDVLDGVVNGKRTNNDATTVHLSGGGAEKVSGGGGALSYDPASDRKLQGLRRGITEIQQKIEIQQQETTAIVQDTEQLKNDAAKVSGEINEIRRKTEEIRKDTSESQTRAEEARAAVQTQIDEKEARLRQASDKVGPMVATLLENSTSVSGIVRDYESTARGRGARLDVARSLRLASILLWQNVLLNNSTDRGEMHPTKPFTNIDPGAWTKMVNTCNNIPSWVTAGAMLGGNADATIRTIKTLLNNLASDDRFAKLALQIENERAAVEAYTRARDESLERLRAGAQLAVDIANTIKDGGEPFDAAMAITANSPDVDSLRETAGGASLSGIPALMGLGSIEEADASLQRIQQLLEDVNESVRIYARITNIAIAKNPNNQTPGTVAQSVFRSREVGQTRDVRALPASQCGKIAPDCVPEDSPQQCLEKSRAKLMGMEEAGRFGPFYGVFEPGAFDGTGNVSNPSNAALYYGNNTGNPSDSPNPWSPGMKGAFDRVLRGGRVAVFGYGYSGSGKTYTWFGNGEDPGLIQLFLDKNKEKIASVDVLVRELYGEAPSADPRAMGSMRGTIFEYTDRAMIARAGLVGGKQVDEGFEYVWNSDPEVVHPWDNSTVRAVSTTLSWLELNEQLYTLRTGRRITPDNRDNFLGRMVYYDASDNDNVYGRLEKSASGSYEIVDGAGKRYEVVSGYEMRELLSPRRAAETVDEDKMLRIFDASDSNNFNPAKAFTSMYDKVTDMRIKAQRIMATPNNVESSRSHLFITLLIRTKDESMAPGWLTVCDLAGSERPMAIAESFLPDFNWSDEFKKTEFSTKDRAEEKLQSLLGDDKWNEALDRASEDIRIAIRRIAGQEKRGEYLFKVIRQAFFINESLAHLLVFLLRTDQSASGVKSYNTEYGYLDQASRDLLGTFQKRNDGTMPAIGLRGGVPFAPETVFRQVDPESAFTGMVTAKNNVLCAPQVFVRKPKRGDAAAAAAVEYKSRSGSQGMKCGLNTNTTFSENSPLFSGNKLTYGVEMFQEENRRPLPVRYDPSRFVINPSGYLAVVPVSNETGKKFTVKMMEELSKEDKRRFNGYAFPTKKKEIMNQTKDLLRRQADRWDQWRASGADSLREPTGGFVRMIPILNSVYRIDLADHDEDDRYKLNMAPNKIIMANCLRTEGMVTSDDVIMRAICKGVVRTLTFADNLNPFSQRNGEKKEHARSIREAIQSWAKTSSWPHMWDYYKHKKAAASSRTTESNTESKEEMFDEMSDEVHGYDEVSDEMFDATHSMSSEALGTAASVVSEFSVGGGLSMVDSMPGDNISPSDTVFDAPIASVFDVSLGASFNASSGDSPDALSLAPTELSVDPAWGVSDLLPEPDWR